MRTNDLIKFVSNEKPTVCYGAGNCAAVIWNFLRENEILLSSFIVTNIGEDTEKLGVKIIQYSNIKNPNDYNWIVGVELPIYQNEIISIIRDNVSSFFLVDNELLTEIRQPITKRIGELKNSLQSTDRCFLLATGSSAKDIDLTLMNDDMLVTCSFISLAKQYDNIKSQIYVSPSAIGDNIKSEKYYEEYLLFVSKTVKSNILILNYCDKAYVDYLQIFRDKKVYYIYETGGYDLWKNKYYENFNLEISSPGSNTAANMMLKVAIYLGYKKIYLVGLDYSGIQSIFKDYKYVDDHLYNISELKDLGFDYLYHIFIKQNNEDYQEKFSQSFRAKAIANTIYAFECMNDLAQSKGIKIYNTSKVSQLEAFEFVDYDELF